MKNTVVFILSSNYSGSTWLALLLGSHSRALYVGELNKMYHDDPVPCRPCEEKGHPCPVFHDVAETKPKHIHHAVLSRTGKCLLVDNSKTVSWSRKFLGEDRFDCKYIHLLRDPRAIAHSLQLRERGPEIDEWFAKNAEIREFLQQNGLDHRVVTYNELADHLDDTLARLDEWLGLAFEPEQKEYWNFEHHGPGRNGATASFLENYVASDEQYYSKRKRQHFHDLRWKEQLDEGTKTEILNHSGLRVFLNDMGFRFSENGLERV